MGNALSGTLGNSILFPAPASSYDADLPNLIWIDEDFVDSYYSPPLNPKVDPSLDSFARKSHTSIPSKTSKIPALFFKADNDTQHTLLYWHGNSCDLGQIYEELHILSSFLGCNICGIEFPGYGLRREVSTSGVMIDDWGLAAFNFLVWIGIPAHSITCFGRSIGTGPACKLASVLESSGIQVAGVVLHAPYKSVHSIVKEYSSLGTWVIEDYWDNEKEIDNLAKSDTPLLIIHGIDDEVIPLYHGKHLLESYKSKNKVGFFPEESSHNAYYVIDDIGKPFEQYLKELSRSRDVRPEAVSIPPYVLVAPKHLTTSITKPGISDIVYAPTTQQTLFSETDSKLVDTQNTQLHLAHDSRNDIALHSKLHMQDSKFEYQEFVEKGLCTSRSINEIVSGAIDQINTEQNQDGTL